MVTGSLWAACTGAQSPEDGDSGETSSSEGNSEASSGSSESGEDPLEMSAIYWTDKSAVAIQRAVAPDFVVETVVEPGPNVLDPRGLVVDSAGAQLFWTDADRGTLMRADLEGQGAELLLGDLKAPADLQLLDGYLYWAERDNNSIARVSVSEFDAPEILVDGINAPYYLAVSADGARVYWSAFDEPVIYTAPLPTSSAEEVEIFVEGLDRVRDVDLSADGQWLYWCDRDASKIQRARVDDPSVVEDLHTQELGTPHGLYLGAELIYWTDTTRSEVRSGAYAGSTSEVVAVDLNAPWSVAMFEAPG